MPYRRQTCDTAFILSFLLEEPLKHRYEYVHIERLGNMGVPHPTPLKIVVLAPVKGCAGRDHQLHRHGP